MKLLSTFATITAITASTANGSFPASHVLLYDPGVIWRATANSGEHLVAAFGAVTALDSVYLGNANFATVTIQGNNSDSWSAPAFSKSFLLGMNDADVRKGFLDITGFNYSYLRVLIPVQTLDSGTYPQLGNLLCGVAQSILIEDYTVTTVTDVDSFQADGGSVNQEPHGIMRHELSLTIAGNLSEIRAIKKSWIEAVLFEDLGYVADSYLVFRPNWSRPTKSPIDARLPITLKEHV